MSLYRDSTIPNATIFLYNVDRPKPNRAAASTTLPPHCASACSISSRSNRSRAALNVSSATDSIAVEWLRSTGVNVPMAARMSAAFNTIPGAGFTVEGPRAAENALRLELGSTVAFNDRYSLFGKANVWSKPE